VVCSINITWILFVLGLCHLCPRHKRGSMKTALALVGLIHIAMYALGASHVIDYHVCIDGPGKCQCRMIDAHGIKGEA
jgi:hypothetical protein